MEETSSSRPVKIEEEQENEKKAGHGESPTVSVWDCGSRLYDSFELASLFHVLDRHTMKLPFLLPKSLPGSGGRMTESWEREVKSTDAISVRRRKMKREHPRMWRSRSGWPAIFRAVAFWKKLNDN